jgi:hypothetical protein
MVGRSFINPQLREAHKSVADKAIHEYMNVDLRVLLEITLSKYFELWL